MIGLEQLSKKYKKGSNFFRTILCRPEFNQFRIASSSYYIFDNSDNFHKMLKSIIILKQKSNKNWHNNIIILFIILLFNCQIALCQHYEPVIIYSPSGEPQTIIKGKIIYDNYGVPKFNIQTKRSMPSLYKKQGH